MTSRGNTPVISRRIKGEPLVPSDSSAGSEGSDSSFSQRLCLKWQMWQRKIPCLKKVQEMYLRVPPRVRLAFVVFWFCWKIVLVLYFLFVFNSHDTNNSLTAHSIGAFQPQRPTRILYIVTALAEYNTGTRATRRGQDRLGEVVIPILVDNVESMMKPPFGYHVDVFLICAYELRPEREEFIRSKLPDGVGFQFWDDAAPLGYDNRNSKDKVKTNTRALARQHRYVIKDKFFYYDLFLAFEDDMRITGDHVQHYLSMSNEIDRLRDHAPTSLDDVPDNVDAPDKTKFFGKMTKQQLSRVIPGFVRVEVILNETANGAQQDILPIPLDYDFDGVGTRHIDPKICCHVHMEPNIETPKTPLASDIIIWESNIKAFSLRQLPPGSSMLDWAVIMMGPGKRLHDNEKIGGFWSGREGAFGDEKKPSGGAPELVAQQGGWMATQDQIARLNSGLCMGSFLPPFDKPVYNGDGQESMNVEFWSGSYQLFTGVRAGCNMQRIISMNPDHFSKHLLYHVANNKQKQLSQNRMVRADHLFAQLNSVQKMAEKAKDGSI